MVSKAGFGARVQAAIAAGLCTLALSCHAGPPGLKPQALADVASIGVPSPLKADLKPAPLPPAATRVAGMTRGQQEALRDALSFGFSSTDLWAAIGTVTAYRQRLVVTLLPPQASAAETALTPTRWNIGYDDIQRLPARSLGSGELTTLAGVYRRGGFVEPSLLFVYTDRSRRLQLHWHVVRKDVSLDEASQQIQRMAESFRILREPLDWFAAMRQAPTSEATLRADRLAQVQAMFKREGLGTLRPGQPVLHRGVYVEWMDDPEPRYQLLVPLGRVRAAASDPATPARRPRPVLNALGSLLPGASLGWQEWTGGAWEFMNLQNDYLPFAGVSAQLATRPRDPDMVYVYLAATVRVDEVADIERLTSLRWFHDALPQVQARWREGALVAPGQPERD